MPGRLQDKVTIITGGGSGFGAGIVKKFVNEGSKVLIWDINPKTPQELASSLPKGSCVPFVGDVSNAEDWQKALDTVSKEFGQLDVVVNNAGVVHNARASIEVCWFYQSVCILLALPVWLPGGSSAGGEA
jgi:3-oxoacyl-[acyl-carrier protein] reductase